MSNAADRESELQSSAGAGFPLGRRFWRSVARVLALGALLLIVGTSVLFVDETEYVIVENLGQIAAVYDSADRETGDRGLHFKLPWPVGTVGSWVLHETI